MEKWYVLASAVMLLWVASMWSTKSGLNVFLKMVFAGLAFCGAVFVAKDFLL